MSAAVPCGCCEPTAGLTPLTVENRPALSQIAYRIGTYADFRRTLLEGLSRPGSLAGLTTRRDDDFAVTLLELWSAVADVLTFYQERYANEAFLRTATQRESVVRLSRLIGYRLAPGAAAVAELAFDVDAAAAPSVRIPVGLRVQSVPGQDELPQTFETVEAVTAEAALNTLRVRPQPRPANPLAPGTRESILARGERGLEAAAALAAGDRVLVFSVEAAGGVEELAVDSLRTAEDEIRVVWETPVEGDVWNVKSRARKAGRTFRLFGHDAQPTYMEPVTVADQPSWKIVTLSGSAWSYVPPTKAPSQLTLDDKFDVKKGTTLLLVGTVGVRLLTVAKADEVQDSFAGRSATVTRLRFDESFDPTMLDRRTTVLHELVGPPIRFAGTAYPATLTGRTMLLPGRRIDASTIEIGRRIEAGALTEGLILDVGAVELGRTVLLADSRGPAATGTLAAATVVGAAPVAGGVGADTRSASELGLAHPDAARGILGARTRSSLPPAPEVTVTIGAVGPRTVPLGADATDLESRLRAADPAPGFAKARVLPLGRRLLVLPGEPDAVVRFGTTASDPESAFALGLHPRLARAALLSGPLGTPTETTPSVGVRIGATGPLALDVTGLTATGAAASRLQALLRARSADPALRWARVLATADDRLVVASGVLQADAEDYLELRVQVDGDFPEVDARTAVLRGNVAKATHGETVPDEVVGSGDASLGFQRFGLAEAPLTYVPSPEPGGIGTTLELLVNGVRWREVASLFGQPPDARVFVSELEADGTTVVQFGDGDAGARLPTGQGNVHAAYRVGIGLTGRVRAQTLTNALDRPRGLGTVTNPLPADGGADPEATEAARTTAPRTVRTFGRAVSLADFEELVKASGEVAKAQAIWAWDGFARGVHLTVARAGGGDFSDAGLRRLADALQSARDPNHPLRVANARAVPIRIAASIQVDPAYVRARVLAAARDALLAALSFTAVRIGEPVALGDVYAVLQSVDGVEAVDVDELAFEQPAGTSDADFQTELDARGVERDGATGAPKRVQPRLRIFPARPDPERRGRVLAGELAVVDAPSQDVVLTATGGLGT